MTCTEARRYQDLYLDGEMAPEERLLMETHLGSCETCRRGLAMEVQVRNAVRQHMREVRAPTRLHEAVRQRLRREPSPGRRAFSVALAAGLVAALVAAWLWTPSGGGMGALEEGAVMTHLAVAAPEVQGDRPTVEAFLRERAPFAIRLPLPEGPSVRLLGARITRVGTRPAVVYLYDAAGHRVSVTQYAPAEREMPEGPRIGRRDGLTVVTYPAGGLVQTMVGDLPESEVSGILPASWTP